MTLLTLDGVACSAPDGTPLFSNLSLSLGAERVGIVGRNGCGKTTLLHAIAGDIAIAAGTIVRPARIGLLRQLPDRPQMRISEALGAHEALERIARVEAGDASEADLAAADWTIPYRLEAALAAAGITDIDPARRLETLSGGERTRVMLAALLVTEPEVLLLDEPTNNLDADGRAAIEALLGGWRGGVMLASHDRALLERMDRIVELTPAGVHIVGGGWRLFEHVRAAAREQATSALERSEKAVRQAARESQREAEKQARRDKAGRKKAAKDADPRIFLGRERERAEKTAARYRKTGDLLVARAENDHASAQAMVERLTPIRIDLTSCKLPASQRLIDARAVVCERGGRRLFGPIDLTVVGPERITITGRNGAGKTSLLRLLIGIDAPAAGQIDARRERMAVLDQHLSSWTGPSTLLEAMRTHNPGLGPHETHAALARYGFRGDWSERLTASLSGGERVRLALACLFSGTTPPQLLILDEPTNHLDMAAVELLEAALASYDGAILCVSHDTRFCQAIGVEREVAL